MAKHDEKDERRKSWGSFSDWKQIAITFCTVVTTMVGVAAYTAGWIQRSVDVAVEAAVGTAVETAVEAAVETAVEAAVETAVEAAVETAVEAAVETAVEAAVETAVKRAMETAISDLTQVVTRLEVGQERIAIRLGARMGSVEGDQAELRASHERLDRRVDGLTSQLISLAMDFGEIKGAVLGLGPSHATPGARESSRLESDSPSLLPTLSLFFESPRGLEEAIEGSFTKARLPRGVALKSTLFTVGGREFLALTIPVTPTEALWFRRAASNSGLFAAGDRRFLALAIPAASAGSFWIGKPAWQTPPPVFGEAQGFWHRLFQTHMLECHGPGLSPVRLRTLEISGRLWHGPLRGLSGTAGHCLPGQEL